MRPVSEWIEKDIDDLHHGEIEESLTLEYKRSDALSKDKEHRRELFKDVSAMANASGGIIIYGMKEIDQKPDGTDEGLDPNVVTREQIENVLMSNIDPPIEGLLIKPVQLTSKGTGNVAYVLQIPAVKSRGRTKRPTSDTTSGSISSRSRSATTMLATSCGAASNMVANTVPLWTSMSRWPEYPLRQERERRRERVH